MTCVNVITGFLGSGKTTTLRHLLSQKPAHENWAILVNEFGEIGIDGALLADQGAVLKEIPGGCMCCVNGLPMQIGLNMLLKQKPDRLLIEPTGLGHPKQILSLLTSETYEAWLTVQATLCLLDARQLAEPRYTENENFRDQLAAADVIVANKQDTYQPEDRQRLTDWAAGAADGRPVVAVQQGALPLEWLLRPRENQRDLPDGAHHHAAAAAPRGLAALSLPGNQRWRRALNQGQGYSSCGWIFDDETVFDTIPLLEWVRLAPVERVKGVLRIAEGTLRINRQGQDLQIETQQVAPADSRIEVINPGETDWNALQRALLKIRLDGNA
ncbi:hypothetical protein CYR32_16655 [Chimaeribacter coloradensis]|uniref:CobW C-terminal domain-containing protein n=1 Tax=Chimaeribacter coloradensis TaxID=2060068 RepID=A0A2N5DWW9_9GAMM|nr:GTP-binding protein [Chimaeribacter coloradensis]PLR31732.1 hypothetical protein CYR32_16655 [Chimaeribacter coloradensis]